METYSFASSYPDSTDSSPPSREVNETWEETAAAAARVKLMVSYGGRIQPRAHDQQLAYVGGETKILAVERIVKLTTMLSKLASMAGAASKDDICLKYQLPGEDLDALISVTDDDDLEHMMIEYDRLRASNASKTPRLRLFLFPIGPPPPPSAALLDPAIKPDRNWFVDALNSVPITEVAATNAVVVTQSPDFLFGLDNGFAPPPAVKVKDPISDPQLVVESNGVSVTEFDRLVLSDQPSPPTAQPPAMKRNSSEETLSKVSPPEFYAQLVPDNPLPSYWPDQRSLAPPPATRYASLVAGSVDHAVYFVPSLGQGFYPAPNPVLYRDGTPMYAVPPPSSAYSPSPLAYDNAGRAVYYTLPSAVAAAATANQTVTSVAEGVKAAGKQAA